MSESEAAAARAEERREARRLAAQVGRSVVGAALAKAQSAGLGEPMESDISRSAKQKAEILVEALPYIRRFAGNVIVVKYGGSLSKEGSEATLDTFVQDISLMRAVGMKPVVVHGGGPQIGEMMARLGKESIFKDGLRVTDAETLEIARMVLVGKVNPEIVAAMNTETPMAVGLSGADAGLITAEARGDELGFVGDVVGVDPSLLNRLLIEELVPVIATIGSDQAGQAYNINADAVAGAVAEALDAEKLIYLTDVPGILSDAGDPASLIATLDSRSLAAMMADGSLRGGMIPKAASCLRAVRSGVGAAHVLDGRVAHAVLLEIFTDEGTGTMITP
ncbi:MAG TPA: acetylglutamate kinase [Acidimicrobiales bacterium]|nr:acetylglutamate kinase [Acidimicrobiales bacterium]